MFNGVMEKPFPKTLSALFASSMVLPVLSAAYPSAAPSTVLLVLSAASSTDIGHIMHKNGILCPFK